MFARVKKFNRHQYLQLFENRKEKGYVYQFVIAIVGRMDQLQKKGRIETEPPSPKIVEAPHHYPNRNQAEPSMIHALFSLPSD